MIQSRGIETISVTSGYDAISLIEQKIDHLENGVESAKIYKLILLDYSMPGMDGPQVAQKIRKLLERSHINFGKYPFICCCTSYSQESFKR